MKKFLQGYIIFLIGIALISFAVISTYSQTDPNERTTKGTYELKVIMPFTMPHYNENNSDLVIQYGPFDNYQVGALGGYAETSICVNPLNPLNFCGTDNRCTGYAGTGNRSIFYTTDGGVTWNASNLPASNQGDPVLTADDQGNFYFACLNSGPEVFKSVNNGATWTGPTVVVANGNADKEWIWADQTTGTFKNNVYVAYVNFSTGASVDFWRSTNNGSSWSGPNNLGTGTPNPGPNICSDLSGRVFVGWYNGSGTAVKISTDGGVTFGSAITASVHSQPGTVACADNRYALKVNGSYGIRVNGMPQLACDMTNGSFSGNVYCAYDCNPPGPKKAGVYMTRSTDHGATWNSGSPVLVDDDNTYLDDWMADVSVDNLGKVWVYFWDTRNDPTNDNLTEVWAACSTNGGQSFMPNFKVSDYNFNPTSIALNQGGTDCYYLGDYQEISGKQFTFPFYTGENNSLQDYTAYLPDFGISFSNSTDSVGHPGVGANTVFLPVMGPYSGTVTLTPSVSPSPSPGTITFGWSPSNVVNINGSQASTGLNIYVSSSVPAQTYTVTVSGAESSGPRVHQRSFSLLVGTFTGVQNHGTSVAKTYQLFQNYPNPFNPTTSIYYTLPSRSLVNLKVYDMLGQEVATLVDNQLQIEGQYAVQFDGNSFASGVYYYRLTAGNFTEVRKMILLK